MNKRIFIFLFSFIVGATASCAEDKNISDSNFELLTGKNVEICESYLKRLNKTDFKYNYPPYCDRPEVMESSSFEKLNRVYLKPEEIYKIYDRIVSFQKRTNQFYSEKIRKRSYLPGSKDKAIEYVKFEQSLKRLHVWRYKPMIDIDNDGALDNVIIWHQQKRRACGSSDGTGRHFPNYTSYILNSDLSEVDEIKTLEVFGHPNQIRPYAPSSKKFRQLNEELSVGVLKYKGVTYFDTFPNGRILNTPSKNNVDLRVYLRKNNTTNLVCEYHWNKRVQK